MWDRRKCFYVIAVAFFFIVISYIATNNIHVFPEFRTGFSASAKRPTKTGINFNLFTTQSPENHLHETDEVTAKELDDFHNSQRDDLSEGNSDQEDLKFNKKNNFDDLKADVSQLILNIGDKFIQKRKESLSEEDEVVKEKPETEMITDTNEFSNKRNILVKEHAVSSSSREEFRHTGSLIRRYPQVIIGGAKKCGTRALLSFLGKHPAVRSAGREMHFFDKNYEKGLEWYLEQMPQSYENEITIEKTPAYFVQRSVPERIYAFNKDVKLIFIFREPVIRVVSDYTQGVYNKKEQRDFEKIIYKKSQPGVINPNNSKIDVGRYYVHLKRWLNYFPMKQMHLVNGDEFIKNPVPGIIAVQKFLNISPWLNEKSFVYNETKGFYCLKRNPADKSGGCLGETKGRKHVEVDQQHLQDLTEFYKPYNKKFFELIEKDYGWPT